MLVYLSGKMSGVEDNNYPAFHEATERLRELGFGVVNPAETAGGFHDIPRSTLLQIDAGYVQACDGIVCLTPLCYESLGAKMELILAASYAKPVWEYCPTIGLGDQLEVYDWEIKTRVIQGASY